MVLAGGNEHANGVVEGALSLIKNVLAGATEHNRASLVLVAASELNHLVFTDKHLLNLVAGAKNLSLRLVEGGEDFGTEHGRESLNAIEVSMLNHGDTSLLKELLGVVVDELTVDEDIGLVGKDFVNLGLHLALLSVLNLTNLVHRVDLDLGAHDLDLVVVERGISNHDFRVGHKLLAASGNGLFKDETISKEGVTESTTGLLDELNVVKVTGTLESHHGVNAELSEALSVVE